jgi:hypothetical protein
MHVDNDQEHHFRIIFIWNETLWECQRVVKGWEVVSRGGGGMGYVDDIGE